MEEDSIKNIFDNYSPPLSDDKLFIAKVMAGADAIDLVKKTNIYERRRLYPVVGISLLTGFAFGVVLTLLFPQLNAFFRYLITSMTTLPAGFETEMVYQTLSYCFISVMCVAATIFSFFIFSPVLNKRKGS